MNINELEKLPFFTGKMLKAFYNKSNPSTALNRWKNSNKIKQIEKGKYTLHEDPKIYATTIITPSYCSFRSALQHYQLTNQIPLKLQIVTFKQKNEIEEIRFVKSEHLFGYTKENYKGFDLFIAEKEKLLIDCLEFPKEGISPDELNELLKEKLDKKKIISFLKQIDNLNLTKRVGYLLELNGIDIHKQFNKQIEKNKNYPKLNQLLPKSNKIDNKWRLNIN